jgi:hypothetical protein
MPEKLKSNITIQCHLSPQIVPIHLAPLAAIATTVTGSLPLIKNLVVVFTLFRFVGIGNNHPRGD